MQEFISVGLAWVANGAVHFSCEHRRIRVPQCRGSAFGQGEVLCLCLQDVLRHVLAFQRGLSWLVRAGGEARPCKRQEKLAAEETSRPGRSWGTAAGAGKWQFLSQWSAVAGLRLTSAVFASHGEARRAFHRVLDSSSSVLPLPWLCVAVWVDGRCVPQCLP